MSSLLKSGERIDQLYAEGIKIIQSHHVFSFSLDAVLLANFPRIPTKGKIVDLCAGNGAISLFISRTTKAPIIAIEIQEKLADMGRRSILLNHLESQITMFQLDLKDSNQVVAPDSVDLILCNPPYFKEHQQSRKNPNPFLALARHEITTNLEEVIEHSAQLLKTKGRLALVHRPDRLIEIFKIMEQFNIYPKRLQLVYPKIGKEANTLLIEGIKGGKAEGLTILPPLYTHDETGQYTSAIRSILYES